MTTADVIRVKNLLPTALGSDELREQIASDILRRSVFSARMESARYLAKIRDTCVELLEGRMNDAQAREQLLEELAGMGYSPTDGGGIANPASVRRLNLVLDTQCRMAASVAKVAGETAESLDQFPGYELMRLEGRMQPREDWPARWRSAGDACDWQGACKTRYVALKDSPIWAELGDGAGGFRDALGNPYPPFAYGSGMGWMDADRATCVQLGLMDYADEIERPDMSLSPADSAIADAVERYGLGDFMADFGGLAE